MNRCAAAGCNARIEDGIVRCPACGADLAKPAAFLQTVGFVTMAIATIPGAIGAVVWRSLNYTPLIVAAVVFLAGIGMVVTARTQNRTAAPTVVPETESEDALL